MTKNQELAEQEGRPYTPGTQMVERIEREKGGEIVKANGKYFLVLGKYRISEMRSTIWFLS